MIDFESNKPFHRLYLFDQVVKVRCLLFEVLTEGIQLIHQVTYLLIESMS